MKKYQLLILSILSGVILSIAWPARGMPFLLFFGFIPLLFIEDHICSNRQQFKSYSFFLYSYIAMFTWNLLTTWWIYNSTFFGVAMAIVFNSLFMSVVMHFFHVTKKKIGRRLGYISFMAYWLGFEYLHLNWDLSWTWLNLGNGFASYHKWIQWYEYTGILGGTLWVLAANILLYDILKNSMVSGVSFRKLYAKIVYAILLIALPIIVSEVIYSRYKEAEKPVDIVIVQPNVDPYNEKFEEKFYASQINKMLLLAESRVDGNTDFVVCPETAIPDGLWEDRLEYSERILKIRQFIKKYPSLKFVIGAATCKMYQEGGKVSATARSYMGTGWYDAYNTALFIDSSSGIQIYHKSQLVLGVEKMPFPKIFKPLEKLAINLGGTTGSLGTQDERSVFVTQPDSLKIAPVICYESIYGEFLNGYIKNGASLIFIITNDGWWGNTPGHRQHLQYAKLRAIETRRSIARSANTGISGFINQRGDLFQPVGWWKSAVIRQCLNANTKITFYVAWGDYIGRIAAYISLLSLLVTIVYSIGKKKGHLN